MSDAERSGSRRRHLASAATAVLATAGLAALGMGLAWQDNPPNPAAEAPTSSIASAGPPPLQQPERAPTTNGADRRTLPASKPTTITIPAIGVSSSLITVGQTPAGSMEVPQPGPNYDRAAWYKHSPTPGEPGPSVIIGHIDSATKGPSVFYELAAMNPGQQVAVQRADGSTAVFTVDRVEKYLKSRFPTLEVYGNTSDAQLRLITCGGSFNEDSGDYRSNVVVYAHLTSTEPA